MGTSVIILCFSLVTTALLLGACDSAEPEPTPTSAPAEVMAAATQTLEPTTITAPANTPTFSPAATVGSRQPAAPLTPAPSPAPATVASPIDGVHTPTSVPDIILFNGQVLTMERDMPLAQALALSGENILAVGANDEILTLGGPETRVIDLDGKALLPGFVDSHNHLFNDAEGLMGLAFEEAQDLALRCGITTIADMFAHDEFLEQMQTFEAEGKLRIRTSLYLPHTDNCGTVWGDWYRDQPPVRDPHEMLRILGVKIFSDGGSCLRPAYSFDLPEGRALEGLQGDLFFSEEELSGMVNRA